MRRTTFTESIKAAEHVSFATPAADVLQPTQKSVQAMRSRAALASQWARQARSGLMNLVQRTAGLRQSGASALSSLTQKTSSAGRLLKENIASRLPHRRQEALQEPNLDVLFAPPSKGEEATPEPKATPTLTLTTAFHRPHAPQKKKVSALQRAQQALQEKKYQHAEDILVDHIVHHTKDTRAYMLLGRVATERADWQEAMEIYEQVIRWQPAEPGAQAGLGIAAYNCGRYSKALQALQRAHEEDPGNLVVLHDLLGIAQKMDNPALQRAIQTKLREAGATHAAHPVNQ